MGLTTEVSVGKMALIAGKMYTWILGDNGRLTLVPKPKD